MQITFITPPLAPIDISSKIIDAVREILNKNTRITCNGLKFQKNTEYRIQIKESEHGKRAVDLRVNITIGALPGYHLAECQLSTSMIDSPEPKLYLTRQRYKSSPTSWELDQYSSTDEYLELLKLILNLITE